MATFSFPAQRLIQAGGFAIAIAAAPAIALLAEPVPDVERVLACPTGEEADQFTGNCVPHTVPNAGSVFSTQPGNPDVPTVLGGIPCIGHNSGRCIGLAEEQQAMTVTPPPAPVFGDGRN